MWAAAALAFAPSLSFPTHIHSHSLAHTQLLLRLLLLLRCCCAATAAADLINSECQQLQQIDLNRTKNQIKSNEMKSKRISICIYVCIYT